MAEGPVQFDEQAANNLPQVQIMDEEQSVQFTLRANVHNSFAENLQPPLIHDNQFGLAQNAAKTNSLLQPDT